VNASAPAGTAPPVVSSTVPVQVVVPETGSEVGEHATDVVVARVATVIDVAPELDPKPGVPLTAA